MFCTKCGAELPDGSNVCEKCGNTMGSAKIGKNLPLPWIIGGGALVVVLIVVVLIIVLGGDKETSSGRGDDTETETAAVSEEPGAPDDGEASGEASAPQGTSAETPADGDAAADTPAAETDNAAGILTAYVENDMIAQMSAVDLDSTYSIPYNRIGEVGNQRTTPGFAAYLGTVVTYMVRDFDDDDTDELFVLLLEDRDADYGLHYGDLYMQMYEYKDGSVQLISEIDLETSLGGTDYFSYNYYLKNTADKLYIVCETTKRNFVLADDSVEGLTVYRYDGEGFQMEFNRAYAGTDLSGYEGDLAEAAARLDSMGFKQTAENLTTKLTANMLDGLQPLLFIFGKNQSEIDYDSYYENDCDQYYLGDVTLYFITSANKFSEIYEAPRAARVIGERR